MSNLLEYNLSAEDDDILEENEYFTINNNIENQPKLIEKKVEITYSEKKEKGNLIKIFRRLEDALAKDENQSINNVYETLLNNENISKREIGVNNDCLLKFMFYFFAPIFNIIFLIGIFEIKSFEKSLRDLLKASMVKYYECNINNDCNITLSDNETNPFDFYNNYYQNSINQTIDFKLTMITGFIGNSLLQSRGFRISATLLGLINIFTVVLLYSFNFDFENKTKDVFDYSWIKLLYLFCGYILLLIGIGGSALLSQQILIDSHIKYKNYIIDKIEERQDNERENEKREKAQEELEPIVEEKKESEKLEKENLREERKRIEQNITNRKKNKFDFFFMICLTTTIAYYGKYALNLILKRKYSKNDVDKKIFFIFTAYVYFLSVFISIYLYFIFVSCIFIKNDNKKKEENKYRICQICGYFIYSEKRIIKKDNKKCKCLKLCCESFKYCCKKTYDIDNCFCCCCCSDYTEDDYDKNSEFFCYCYQAQRKSFWCLNFITNDAQKKIIPCMIEYFLMQLITFAFEMQYEKYKGKEEHIKTFSLAFVISLFLFFYSTISLSKFDGRSCVRKEERKIEKNEIISKISNAIVNGAWGVLLMIGVFSLILSSFYYSDFSFKKYVFEENVNIILIPILMNKFFYLTLNYYCSFTSEDNKQFEFISISTLISIYMTIWDTLFYFFKTFIIRRFENYYMNIFYWIQLSFSAGVSWGVVVLFIGGIIISFISGKYCSFHKYLLWLFIFLFGGGGLWLRFDSSDDSCELISDCCCCDKLSCCYIECLDDCCYNGSWTCCDCCCH